MRKGFKSVLISAAGSAMLASAAWSAPLTPGNVVIYRVGDGSAGLVNTGVPVFLDEYNPAGTLVQSIPMPTTASGANKALFASGTASSEGLINLSADGQYIIATGYASTHTSSLSSTAGTLINRVVARVDMNGVIDTSTALTDFASGNNPRSATSVDGTGFWVAGGAGGVRYASLGGTTSTDLTTGAGFTNVRAVSIYDGQLYASSGSGTNTFRGVETIGTGLPTSGAQTVTRLAGLTDTLSNGPYQFLLADLDATVPGVDTLYFADDSTTSGGISKFALVSGTWTYVDKVGTSADAYRGLAGVVESGIVTLYATRKGGTAAVGGGELVSLIDTNGYNLGFSSTTPTLLATAGTNTAFRGVVAVVPEPSAVGLLGIAAGLLARRRARGL